MHDSQRRPDVRIRTEGSDIVVTLDPQQAHDLARLIEQSNAPDDHWTSDAAKTLRATAGELAPDRGVGHRRALRLPGYSAVPRVAHVQSARRRAATPPPPLARRTPRTVDGQPVTRRESLRTAAGNQPTRRTSSPSPSTRSSASGSGLAAAVAVFADAIAVGGEARAVPPAKPPRKAVSAEERARHLQEVLDAAAAASRESHAEV